MTDTTTTTTADTVTVATTTDAVSYVDPYTVISAESPAWGDADHTFIGLTVTFECLKDTLGAVHFCARQDDPETHGQDIYARAVAGDFGTVAEYTAPVYTTAELEATARVWRDAEITASQWLVERHRDQTEAGTATTLTSAQYTELLTYRQALRDWPTVTDFPADSTKPTTPTWLAAAEAATDAA